jgi:hypothetical protein
MKTTTEECYSLDVCRLSREGLLKPGWGVLMVLVAVGAEDGLDWGLGRRRGPSRAGGPPVPPQEWPRR